MFIQLMILLIVFLIVIVCIKLIRNIEAFRCCKKCRKCRHIPAPPPGYQHNPNGGAGAGGVTDKDSQKLLEHCQCALNAANDADRNVQNAETYASGIINKVEPTTIASDFMKEYIDNASQFSSTAESCAGQARQAAAIINTEAARTQMADAEQCESRARAAADKVSSIKLGAQNANQAKIHRNDANSAADKAEGLYNDINVKRTDAVSALTSTDISTIKVAADLLLAQLKGQVTIAAGAYTSIVDLNIALDKFAYRSINQLIKETEGAKTRAEAAQTKALTAIQGISSSLTTKQVAENAPIEKAVADALAGRSSVDNAVAAANNLLTQINAKKTAANDAATSIIASSFKKEADELLNDLIKQVIIVEGIFTAIDTSYKKYSDNSDLSREFGHVTGQLTNIQQTESDATLRVNEIEGIVKNKQVVEDLRTVNSHAASTNSVEGAVGQLLGMIQGQKTEIDKTVSSQNAVNIKKAAESLFETLEGHVSTVYNAVELIRPYQIKHQDSTEISDVFNKVDATFTNVKETKSKAEGVLNEIREFTAKLVAQQMAGTISISRVRLEIAQGIETAVNELFNNSLPAIKTRVNDAKTSKVAIAIYSDAQGLLDLISKYLDSMTGIVNEVTGYKDTFENSEIDTAYNKVHRIYTDVQSTKNQAYKVVTEDIWKIIESKPIIDEEALASAIEIVQGKVESAQTIKTTINAVFPSISNKEEADSVEADVHAMKNLVDAMVSVLGQLIPVMSHIEQVVKGYQAEYPNTPTLDDAYTTVSTILDYVKEKETEAKGIADYIARKVTEREHNDVQFVKSMAETCETIPEDIKTLYTKIDAEKTSANDATTKEAASGHQTIAEGYFSILTLKIQFVDKCVETISTYTTKYNYIVEVGTAYTNVMSIQSTITADKTKEKADDLLTEIRNIVANKQTQADKNAEDTAKVEASTEEGKLEQYAEYAAGYLQQLQAIKLMIDTNQTLTSLRPETDSPNSILQKIRDMKQSVTDSFAIVQQHNETYESHAEIGASFTNAQTYKDRFFVDAGTAETVVQSIDTVLQTRREDAAKASETAAVSAAEKNANEIQFQVNFANDFLSSITTHVNNADTAVNAAAAAKIRDNDVKNLKEFIDGMEEYVTSRYNANEQYFRNYPSNAKILAAKNTTTTENDRYAIIKSTAAKAISDITTIVERKKDNALKESIEKAERETPLVEARASTADGLLSTIREKIAYVEQTTTTATTAANIRDNEVDPKIKRINALESDVKFYFRGVQLQNENFPEDNKIKPLYERAETAKDKYYSAKTEANAAINKINGYITTKTTNNTRIKDEGDASLAANAIETAATDATNFLNAIKQLKPTIESAATHLLAGIYQLTSNGDLQKIKDLEGPVTANFNLVTTLNTRYSNNRVIGPAKQKADEKKAIFDSVLLEAEQIGNEIEEIVQGKKELTESQTQSTVNTELNEIRTKVGEADGILQEIRQKVGEARTANTSSVAINTKGLVNQKVREIKTMQTYIISRYKHIDSSSKSFPNNQQINAAKQQADIEKGNYEKIKGDAATEDKNIDQILTDKQSSELTTAETTSTSKAATIEADATTAQEKLGEIKRHLQNADVAINAVAVESFRPLIQPLVTAIQALEITVGNNFQYVDQQSKNYTTNATITAAFTKADTNKKIYDAVLIDANTAIATLDGYINRKNKNALEQSKQKAKNEAGLIKDKATAAQIKLDEIRTKKVLVDNATTKQAATPEQNRAQTLLGEIQTMESDVNKWFQGVTLQLSKYTNDRVIIDANDEAIREKENYFKHKMDAERVIIDINTRVNLLGSTVFSPMAFPAEALAKRVVWISGSMINGRTGDPIPLFPPPPSAEGVTIESQGGPNNRLPIFINETISDIEHKYIKLQNNCLKLKNLTIGVSFSVVICCRLNNINRKQPLFNTYTQHHLDNNYDFVKFESNPGALNITNRIQDNEAHYSHSINMSHNDRWRVFGMYLDLTNMCIFYDENGIIQRNLKNGRGFNVDKGKMEYAHIGKTYEDVYGDMDIKEIAIMSGASLYNTELVADYMRHNHIRY